MAETTTGAAAAKPPVAPEEPLGKDGWLVRSRGRLLHLRDGEPGPLYEVDASRWFPFQNLPRGVDPLNDSDAVYREAKAGELALYKPASLYGDQEEKRRVIEARERAEARARNLEAEAARVRAGKSSAKDRRKGRARGA